MAGGGPPSGSGPGPATTIKAAARKVNASGQRVVAARYEKWEANYLAIVVIVAPVIRLSS